MSSPLFPVWKMPFFRTSSFRFSFSLFLVCAVGLGPSAGAEAQTVTSGRVLDAATSEPIAAATVRSPTRTVRTGPDGAFRLGAEAGATLQVVRPGYLPQTVSVPAGSSELTIRLQPDLFDLAGITVTASRGQRSRLDEPANVTVIERGEIERRMAATIEDLVRLQPGVRVFRQTSGTDPFNSFQGFTVRGVSGNRVQMVVDGSRVQERIIDGTRDLVDPANMKAVEVVRGPASALWGSDALGGLVAFETKDPEDYMRGPDDRAGAQIDLSWSGLDGGRTATVATAGRLGGLSALLSYSRREAREAELSLSRNDDGIWPCTRNPQATPCNRLDPTELGSHNLLGKVVLGDGSSHRLEVTGEYFVRGTEVDQGWDRGPVVNFRGDTTAVQTAYTRWQDLDRRRLQLQHSWDASLPLLNRLEWSITHHPQRSIRTGDRRRTLASGQLEQRLDSLDYEESFTEFDLQLSSGFQLGGSTHTLTWGIDGGYTATDYRRVDVTTNLSTNATTVAPAGGFNFANADTRRFDAYIQDEIGLAGGRLSLIPAVRVATYEISPRPDADYRPVPGAEPRTISETAVTPRFGVMLRDGYLSAYAQYARGFKMPTAQQLYTSLPGTSFVLVPNPNLRPEEVDAWEAGVRAEGSRGYFSLNGFFNDYNDFIQSFVFVPNTNPQEITYQNLSAVAIYGVEASGGWQWTDRLAGTLALSWQRGDLQPDADSSATRAFDSAEPLGAVGTLRWVDPGLGLDVEVNGTFQAGVDRVSGPNVFRPDGYRVFGAVLQWSPLDHITVRASVDNLFNERYLLPTSTAYTQQPASPAVAATNPIELQVQPGRHFRLGLSVAY
jgi:hemoglobin/transferrin/lactoferrin receptor protein